MSPSVWWDDCAVYKIVDAIDETAKPPLKIWLDTGASGGRLGADQGTLCSLGGKRMAPE